ncbi:hypothetical protein BC835DRAFT_547471, partial [Cytidiella melzeri]
VIDSDATVEVPSDTVIQSPWTLTKGIDFVKYLDYDCDEPLMRVTITRYTKTGSTSIGLSGTHALGDGFVMLQFVRLLSQHYQGLQPLDPPPRYDNERYRPSSADMEEYGEIPIPDLDHVYPLRETAPHNRPERIKPEQLSIRMTAFQVRQLHKNVQTQVRELEPQLALSRQDVLVALLVYCISHAEAKLPAIQHISNLIMTRGIGSKPSHSAGNAILWTVAQPAEDFAIESVATIAARIRKALLRARQPGYVAAFDALREQKLVQITNAELGQDFLTRPGHMIVNSTWKFDWTSAHFGFPDKTRFFHTLITGPRFVKIFRPNPTLLQDGTWRASSPDDAEITFFIAKESSERFKDLFKQEVQAWGLAKEGVKFLGRGCFLSEAR